MSAGFIWSHEAKRVFHSGLARIRDAEWLQDQLQSVSNKVCLYLVNLFVPPFMLSLFYVYRI